MSSRQSIEKAAKRFYAELRPGWSFAYADDPIKALVIAAFELYDRAWHGSGGRIATWRWPFDELKEHQPFRAQPSHGFKGDEPWTVLFRRAVEITEADTNMDHKAA